MTNPVIVRLEKFIPRNGGPVVFQVFEEVEVSPGRWLQLDPRNPTAEEVQSADDKAIAQQQATIATLTTERDSLQSDLTDAQSKCTIAESQVNQLEQQLDAANEQIATLTAERDALQQQANTLAAQVAQLTQENATALARIAELEAQLNPPNPFPDADWQGFRSAALASPVILRMAMSNVGNFMMLLIYMTELQKDPAVAAKMAGVWNEMEAKTPLNTQEIAEVNALAESHSVPFALNSEGQIQL